MRTLLNKILNRLPAKMAGAIEHRIGFYKTFAPFGGPMNGQTARLEAVRSIIEACEIEQVIETGTYRGATTQWFAQFGIPVFSAEVQPRFATFAQRRMADQPTVRIENIDSVTALARWSKDSDIVSRRTLFYLDAHWEEYLPLRKELELISQNFPSWVIVVDDFKVPSDADYIFDDFGPEKVLDMEYIARCDIGNTTAFFPTVRSKWETGAKRGCVVLVADALLTEKCARLPLLRSGSSI